MSTTQLSSTGRIAIALVAGLAIAAVLQFHGDQAPAQDATASAVKPRIGLYRGKTRQGGPVSFRVKRRSVRRPAFTLYNRRCGVRITFPTGRRVNRRGRFFFGRKSSDFFTGRFVGRARVTGKAAVDFGDSSCPGRSVKEVRFRARLVR